VWGLEGVKTQWSLLCATLNLRVLYARWRANRPPETANSMAQTQPMAKKSKWLTNASDVLSSGFDIILPEKNPQQPLTQPQFTLDNTVPGQLGIYLQAVPNAKAYHVQYGTGTGPMIDRAFSPTPKIWRCPKHHGGHDLFRPHPGHRRFHAIQPVERGHVAHVHLKTRPPSPRPSHPSAFALLWRDKMGVRRTGEGTLCGWPRPDANRAMDSSVTSQITKIVAAHRPAMIFQHQSRHGRGKSRGDLNLPGRAALPCRLIGLTSRSALPSDKQKIAPVEFRLPQTGGRVDRPGRAVILAPATVAHGNS
jgi:hypothetical protein